GRHRTVCDGRASNPPAGTLAPGRGNLYNGDAMGRLASPQAESVCARLTFVPRTMRWLRRSWAPRALAAALLLAGGGWCAVSAPRAAPEPAARFETVRRGDVEVLVTETGTIEPLKKVEVKSKVAGRISRLLVDEGLRVRAGQLLAEIDPTEINSQV